MSQFQEANACFSTSHFHQGLYLQEHGPQKLQSFLSEFSLDKNTYLKPKYK